MFIKTRFNLICLLLLAVVSEFLVCSGSVSADPAKQKYLAADSCYKKLRNSSSLIKYHSNWINCIDKYQEVYKQYPDSSWAPAGMYQAAQLFLNLYKISGKKSDQSHAIDLLNRLTLKYPTSAYSYRAARLFETLPESSDPFPSAPSGSDAREATLKQSRKALTKKDIPPPVTELLLQEKNELELILESKLVPDTGHQLETLDQDPPEMISPQIPHPQIPHPRITPAGDTYITDLRFWSNPEYTRIVINAADERPFTHRLLKQDPTINVPFQRLYVDIEKSRLDNHVSEHTPINDNLLKQARAGQYTTHTVRVVVDIKSFDNYKIFSLKDPFRIVIDVWGKPQAQTDAVADSPRDTTKRTPEYEDTQITQLTTDNIKSSDIARQLALNVRKIVIDPGHGGRDPGAPGYLKGVWEKDVVLSLAIKLAEILRTRLQCEVILTRNSDVYLTLEERTAIANTKKADLFISLHTNAAKNRSLSGIETYFLNLATDGKAIAVAARENATSEKNISDLETILNDLMKNAKIKESSRLATDVHSSLVSGMSKKFSQVNDLGVKQAPFYVLLGATMPSILIETSFISNSEECKRLIDPGYQEALCHSITDGIEKYIKATNPQKL